MGARIRIHRSVEQLNSPKKSQVAITAREINIIKISRTKQIKTNNLTEKTAPTTSDAVFQWISTIIV